MRESGGGGVCDPLGLSPSALARQGGNRLAKDAWVTGKLIRERGPGAHGGCGAVRLQCLCRNGEPAFHVRECAVGKLGFGVDRSVHGPSSLGFGGTLPAIPRFGEKSL